MNIYYWPAHSKENQYVELMKEAFETLNVNVYNNPVSKFFCDAIILNWYENIENDIICILEEVINNDSFLERNKCLQYVL